MEIQKKTFYVKLCLCVCARTLVQVCQIPQTPGWHGWVRELAYNEGDVPQLLPVSDASLNQEWREKLTLLANKSSLLSRQMWAHICKGVNEFINGSESFYHPQTVYDTLACRDTQCLLQK